MLIYTNNVTLKLNLNERFNVHNILYSRHNHPLPGRWKKTIWRYTMALIKCSECGNEISDHAAACPKCGNPITPAPILPDEQKTETQPNEPQPQVQPITQQQTQPSKETGTWAIGKLTIGIISMVLFFIIGLQSCAATFANAFADDGSSSGINGFLLAVFMVIAGIVGVITRNSKTKAGPIVTTSLYGLGSLMTIGTGATYGDLPIWGAVSFSFGLVFLGSILANLPVFKEGRNRTFFKAGLTVAIVLSLIVGSAGSGSKEITSANSVEITNSDKESSNTTSNTKTTTKPEVKKIKLNETALITTSEGSYKITFTAIEETNDRNKFSDITADRVVILSYEYENIDHQDGINVSSWKFRVFDKSGTALETYPVSTKYGETLSPGRKSSATEAYALNHSENYIEVEYYDNTFNSMSDCIFQLEW